MGCFNVLDSFDTTEEIAQLEYSHLEVCTCVIHCMDYTEKNYKLAGIMDG